MKKPNWRISCNAFSWEPRSGNTSGCSLLNIWLCSETERKQNEREQKQMRKKFLYPSLPCMEQSSGLVSRCPEFSIFGHFLNFTSCHGHPEKVWQIEKCGKFSWLWTNQAILEKKGTVFWNVFIFIATRMLSFKKMERKSRKIGAWTKGIKVILFNLNFSSQ